VTSCSNRRQARYERKAGEHAAQLARNTRELREAAQALAQARLPYPAHPLTRMQRNVRSHKRRLSASAERKLLCMTTANLCREKVAVHDNCQPLKRERELANA